MVLAPSEPRREMCGGVSHGRDERDVDVLDHLLEDRARVGHLAHTKWSRWNLVSRVSTTLVLGQRTLIRCHVSARTPVNVLG